MPVEYTVPSLRIAVQNRLGDEESLRERLNTLLQMEERRTVAQWATEVAQRRRKLWHDKHLRQMKFSPGQLVLKYDGQNELRLGKFRVRWLGPYKIEEVGANGAIKLSTLDGNPIKTPVNGHR